MDLDNLQQNMNTRVVFKEPRGMVRWLQLLFAIIAVSTVCDFYSTIGMKITCPTDSSSSTTTSTTSTTSTTAASTNLNKNDSNSQLLAQEVDIKLVIDYPFDFSDQTIANTCPGHNYTYKQVGGLTGSPQFFVLTGFFSLFYAIGTLIVYLLFSSTYDSLPIMPVGDLLIAAILCLFWFIASSSFSSGVSILKSSVDYKNLEQTICPAQFKSAGGTCLPNPEFPDWKSVNVSLVSGFASFFLWGFGLWFVYKETHFHTPRGPL